MVWHRWGHGPVVVLLHGGYGSWTHWIRTVDALAARFDVLAADLPGLGDSAMPPEPYDAWAIARIVADGLDLLIPRSERYDLVGFSFGASVGGTIASLAGARVRSLTLVGAGGLGPLRRPIELRSWRELADPEARVAAHRANLASLMIADPAKIDDLAVKLQADNAARARLRRRSIVRTAVLDEILPTLDVPLNAIYGALDATTDPTDRERRLREIDPSVGVRVIPGAGHWVQYEAPEPFNAALIELLETPGG